MAVINVKGLSINLMKGDAVPIAVVPTVISNANPAIVTVADVTGILEGSLATVGTVGDAALNGGTFVVGVVDGTGNTFELVGADTSGNAGAIVVPAGAEINVYAAADMVKLCLSSIDIGAPSVNQIDISTFCGDGTMSGRATPGSVTLNGYADKTDAGVLELIKADEDGATRLFMIELPNNNGHYLGKISLAGFVLSFPNEGAVAFTVTGSQVEKIHWVI